ncbi:MAG TPA: polysaccharide biosynthesis tyrosine autokinase [Gemmatimonadaceae bacterium]
MPANLVPADPNNGGVPAQYASGGSPWATGPVAPPTSTISEQLGRFVSAIKHYKWLILAVVAVGSSAGFALTRLVSPKYTVQGSIIIRKSTQGTGPITAPGLINDPNSWADLTRSFIVLDQVVQQLGLYVRPHQAADSVLVSDLRPSALLRPGAYELRVDANGTTYELVRPGARAGDPSVTVETGVLGDSIGRSAGFLWQPEPGRFRPGSTTGFTVITPRDAAVRIYQDLIVPPIGTQSNLLRLQMSGENPVLLAATMNTLLAQFVKEAHRLSKDNLTTIAGTVREQMLQAGERLRAAEGSLEAFKVNTITMPNENTVVSAGVSIATNPVFGKFFNDNVAHKTVLRDRQALAAIVNGAGQDSSLSYEALKALPPRGLNDPLDTELRNLEVRQAELRKLQERFTDAHSLVVAKKEEIRILEQQTIPLLARQTLQQLEIQEAELRRNIEGQAGELRQIPERTIEEARRAREVVVAEAIYTDLQKRYANAVLAEASAVPDVAVFDTASVPSRPSSDTATSIFIVAILASLGLGIGAAILLDQTDRRFRYPEQATRDLGLDIMSGIPTIRNPRNASARLQEASQLVEAFRSLSLTVRSAFDGIGPVVLTVSSPGPGDGKSFVSANLAMALADGGYKTVVIDGDIRRGALHTVFSPAAQTPGLTDYLAGESVLNEVLLSTSHPGLFLVPCGTRRRNGPELLAGEAMLKMVRELRQQFDAIIVDSAPLGAGIDPFALGVATGAMLVVLRTGETDRKLAQAKLEVLDRMPVRVLGTVLNDIGESPQFKYYYYLEGYGALETAAAEASLIESGTAANGNGAGRNHS